jgi:alkaline phosphatase
MVMQINISFINIAVILIAIFSSPIKATGQNKIYSVQSGHAHNDYEQPVPFRSAYHAGFGSIEADVCLINGNLFIAHEAETVKHGFTLENIYLKPLADEISVNNGYAYADTARSLILLLDVKTAAGPTLLEIVEAIRKYPLLINAKNLHFIISGNIPVYSDFSLYPSFISFDGRPENMDHLQNCSRIALFSTDIKKYSDWNGKSNIPGDEQKKLESLVQTAHRLNKPFRFWGTPDLENAWQELMDLEVDYINTDKQTEFARFFNK